MLAQSIGSYGVTFPSSWAWTRFQQVGLATKRQATFFCTRRAGCATPTIPSLFLCLARCHKSTRAFWSRPLSFFLWQHSSACLQRRGKFQMTAGILVQPQKRLTISRTGHTSRSYQPTASRQRRPACAFCVCLVSCRKGSTSRIPPLPTPPPYPPIPSHRFGPLWVWGWQGCGWGVLGTHGSLEGVVCSGWGGRADVCCRLRQAVVPMAVANGASLGQVVQ